MDSDIAHDAGEMDWARRDPADRLIVATARALGCPLLTADEAILTHAAAGHLKAIDARR
ncbi:PIN domain-containing protein [Sphingomonas sp. MMS24-JH45]